MKKILPLLLIIVLLPACGVSREVRNVINSIDSLSEITLESGTILDDIESAYNALSDEEKQQVDNLSILEEAREQYKELERKQKNESILEELNTQLNDLRILKATKTEDISSAIMKIEHQYSLLDEDYKEQSGMYNKLDSCIMQSVKGSVKYLLTKDTTTANAIVKKYKDYLKSEDILSLLGDIGLQRCINDATYQLNRINSGKVYNVTNVNAYCVEDGEKTSYKVGENKVMGQLSISGTNYFGGPYTQEINMYYTFNINVESCSISGVTGFTY